MTGADWTGKGQRRVDPDRPRPLADAVLRLIWNEKRISRADIARLAVLSRSTVSEIVGEILPTGLVAEVGVGESRGGRRPIVLEFQEDTRVILGVEMGAAHVSVALTDLRGRVLAWQEREHSVRTDPVGTRALILELCEACLATRGQDSCGLVGIGIAAASPVDPEQKLRHHVASPATPSGGKEDEDDFSAKWGRYDGPTVQRRPDNGGPCQL